MQKAFEKIIKKFEERRGLWENVNDKDSANRHIATWNKAIKIVNQIAEEYVPDTSISHAAWETIYRRLLEVIDEYATVGDIANVKDCKVLSDLLRHYKEQLTEEFKPKSFQTTQELKGDNQSSGWISVGEKYPDTEDYILLSFENFPHPLVGNYKTDKDGGAFYLIGDEQTCVQQYMFVNAWMPIKPYREKE